MKTLKIMIALLGLQFGLHAQWISYDATQIRDVFGKYAATEAVNKAGIRCMSDYIPSNLPGLHEAITHWQMPILVVLIHGTFASEAAEYHADGTTTFDAVKSFAQTLAEVKGTTARVVSYKWSGENKHKARVGAGQCLAEILNKYARGFQVITVAHSHGGNVVNVATNYLHKTKIDTVVHIATPVIENTNEDYRPNTKNFNLLLDLYTTGDIIQFIGSIDGSRGMAHMVSTVGSSRKFKVEKDKTKGRIVNIHTQIEGEDIDHSSIKEILPTLTTILAKLGAYTVHNDLDMNIDLSPELDLNSKVLLAIRHQDVENPEAEDEVWYSNMQKDIFRYLYEKEMGYKGNTLFERAYNLTSNTLAMAKPFKMFQNYFKQRRKVAREERLARAVSVKA